MQGRPRIVLDTNALVSRLLLPDSIPGQSVKKTVEEGEILMSESTLFELADGLEREKFNAYSIQDREEFLRMLGRIVEMVTILHAVHDCRDVPDNKILEVAVNGQAKVIVAGDEDLLALNPFRGISIIRPVDYFLKWEDAFSSLT